MPENPSAPAFPALYDGVSKIDGIEGAVVPGWFRRRHVMENMYGKHVWKTCMENTGNIHRKQFRLPLVIFCSL
jgi:hypothetical protein